MNYTNSLRQVVATLSIILLLPGGAQARTRKGDKYHKEGQKLEARQLLDEALDQYEMAMSTDPSDPGYSMSVKRARFQAAQKHVTAGTKLRKEGQLEGAVAEFQRAIARDPSSAIALQEWKRTSEAIEKEKTTGKVDGPERGMTAAERSRRDANDRAASMLAPPELQPVVRVMPPLKMNNQPPRVLYETVGKLAGINVIFDPGYTPQSKNLNVEFSNSTVEQALDYLAVLTKTFWKPISSNTVFVTDDNVTKRRDYEDNVVKVFYVQNATSVQEFQEIATAVRSLTEIRRVFTYNGQKAILMRGTPDQIALAEKLIHDLDKPKAEVVIDVIVMEANSSKTRTLAATLAGGGGLNIPVAFTPRNPILSTGSTAGTGSTGTSTPGGSLANGTSGVAAATTTNSGVSLSTLSHVSTNDFSTTLPGALLNLVMSDRQTRVLQSPQVRASDGQKVTLRIGDKIPYATGSFQPGVGSVGVGVSPLVSTQFNFAEVGVNVDITPQVHGTDEVTLKIAIEVSNVRDHVTIGGVDQPVIGQRKNETEIRLREGEVNILGGLAQYSDSKTLGGIPGLVNIPILGRFLGGENTDKERGELLIALIPHIVRVPNYSEADMKAVATGTDQTFKIGYSARLAPAGQNPPLAPATPTEIPVPVKPIPATPVTPTAPAGPAKLSFMPASVSTQLSGGITVALQGENMTDLAEANPIKIKFDPMKLRLVDVTAGELMSRDGQKVVVARDVRNDAGEASVTLLRPQGATGISGTGSLATFTFIAIGKGSAPVTVTEFGLKNTHQSAIVVSPVELPVTIQ